jgi:Family of unknown function (DUF5989)
LFAIPRKPWAREAGFYAIDSKVLLRGSSLAPFMSTTSDNRGFLSDLWALMRREKKWWLVPLAVVGTLLVLAAVLGENSPLAPFIYSFI